MKTFSQILAEVAQPKAGDEIDFKDKHIVQKVDYPVDVEDQFTSKKPKAPKRRADYANGEDETVYESVPDGSLKFSVYKHKNGKYGFAQMSNGTWWDHTHNSREYHNTAADAAKHIRKIWGKQVGSIEMNESSFDVPTAAGGEYDEEDSHRKYKSSNKSKALHREAKLDPVGKEDDDIDNDGDVDSSDEYLHNRRRAIKKAMRESIEVIAEKAKSEAQQKAAAIALAVKRGDMPKSALQGASAAMYKMSEKDLEDFAKTKHKGIPEKVGEEVELDEISKSTLSSYVKKAKKSNPVTQARKNYFSAHGKLIKSTKDNQDELLGNLEQKKKDFDKAAANRKSRLKYVKLANKKLAKEELELDEAMKLDKVNHVYHDTASENFAKEYVKGNKGDYQSGGPSEKHEKDSEKFHTTYKRVGGKSGFGGSGHDIYQHTKTGEKYRVDRQSNGKGFYGTDHRVSKINEEVELDEISKSTLGRYIKKASSDMANNAYNLGARDPLKKPGSWDKAFKRKTGIEKATDRLTREEAEQLDELSPNTLHRYIKKAVPDIASRTISAVSPNQSAQTKKHASKLGKRIQGVTSASGRLADKANMAEEIELDEVSTEKLRDYASAALQDKNKAKADKRWKYASKAMNTVADREVKAAHARKYNKMEEVELDEMDSKSSAYKKALALRKASAKARSSIMTSKPTKLDKEYRATTATKRFVKEETEQLDELSPSTLKSYMKKAGKSERDLEKKDKEVSSAISKVHTAVGKKSAAANAAHRATTQKASNKAGTQYRAADKQIKDTSGLLKQKSDIQRKLANRMDGMGRASEKLQKEEVEQINEISKDALRSYRSAALSRNKSDFDDLSAERERAMKKYGHNHSAAAYDLDKSIKRRGKYINLAAKKMNTKKEEVNQIDEISDKLKAKYLDKAVQQRYDFFKEPWDPKKEPKWATPGGKPKKGYYDQPHKVKAREKDNRRGEIIDKTAKKLTGKPHYSTMSTVTTPGQEGNAADWWKGKKYTKEEFELNEAFKAGSVKLNDGSSVALKEQDAKLMNLLFADLNADNKKKMMAVAMKDKSGFNEILGFAREAL